MICPVCEGKGIVPAEHSDANHSWDGVERRRQGREASNEVLRFKEAVPAARYRSCPRCQGSGKAHPNLMHV